MNGVGTLIIRNAQPSDAGAYTCEAINNQNAIFGNPDAIVTVNGGRRMYNHRALWFWLLLMLILGCLRAVSMQHQTSQR